MDRHGSQNVLSSERNVFEVTRSDRGTRGGIFRCRNCPNRKSVRISLRRSAALGRPVCIGHSRKRFLQKLIGRPVDERVFGTVGVSVAVALQGADMIRVHDVAATRDTLLACQAVLAARAPQGA